MDEFYDEEYYSDQEGEYKAEITAYERSGHGGRLSELLSSSAVVSGMDEVYKLSNISPEDRFLILVDAISRRFNNDGIIEITQADITTMLEKTGMMMGVRYKNPIAYILGFLATNGGSKIVKKNIDHIINKVLPKIGDEGGVYPPDVIRYARYWVMNL